VRRPSGPPAMPLACAPTAAWPAESLFAAPFTMIRQERDDHASRRHASYCGRVRGRTRRSRGSGPALRDSASECSKCSKCSTLSEDYREFETREVHAGSAFFRTFARASVNRREPVRIWREYAVHVRYVRYIKVIPQNCEYGEEHGGIRGNENSRTRVRFSSEYACGPTSLVILGSRRQARSASSPCMQRTPPLGPLPPARRRQAAAGRQPAPRPASQRAAARTVTHRTMNGNS
jgi:hypothetical protein